MDDGYDPSLEEGRRLRDAGMDAAVAGTSKEFRAAWRDYVEALPTGWIGIAENISYEMKARGWRVSDQTWGGMVAGAKVMGILDDPPITELQSRTSIASHASKSPLLIRTNKLYNGNRRDSMGFDLGERIKQVRMVEDMIDKKQEELDTMLEQHHKFVETGRAEILAFLNQTNQKSANTEFGGCHWKPKITYRVEDKDAFRRHVVGAEAWELITFAAAPVNCEAFTEEHKLPPPGLVRNAVNILYITPPTKPKGKNKKVEV